MAPDAAPADDGLAAYLERLDAIEQAATEGPWHWVQEGRGDKVTLVSGPWRGHDEGGWLEVLPVKGSGPSAADADFIEQARTAMPLLVAAIGAVLAEADSWAQEIPGAIGPGYNATRACGRRAREIITRELTGAQLSEDGERG